MIIGLNARQDNHDKTKPVRRVLGLKDVEGVRIDRVSVRRVEGVWVTRWG